MCELLHSLCRIVLGDPFTFKASLQGAVWLNSHVFAQVEEALADLRPREVVALVAWPHRVPAALVLWAIPHTILQHKQITACGSRVDEVVAYSFMSHSLWNVVMSACQMG